MRSAAGRSAARSNHTVVFIDVVHMAAFHLAQLNVAVAKEPLTAPGMADFVNNLDRINALAESAPGFIWRLQDADGNATSLRPFDANTLVNMSVWQDVQSLKAYVYTSAHMDFVRRRQEWFERVREAFVVLWWVQRGHHPTVHEAVVKLEHLRAHGPTADAFTFGKPFPPPGATASLPQPTGRSGLTPEVTLVDDGEGA